MAKSSGPHVPTMLVVGLGMVLIAGLAAVAAWAWANKRGPLIAGHRTAPAATPGRDVVENGAGSSIEAAEA